MFKELCDMLFDYQNLSDFFNVLFKVLKVENDNEISGGKGCVREVIIFSVCFKEEIIYVDINGIEYRVVDDFLVKVYRGVIVFMQQENLINVFYCIICWVFWYILNWLLMCLL